MVGVRNTLAEAISNLYADAPIIGEPDLLDFDEVARGAYGKHSQRPDPGRGDPARRQTRQHPHRGRSRLLRPQLEQARQVALECDATLDPQLIWRGKYDVGDPANGTDLVTDAPPMYIQGKFDPRVLVENLRKTARAGEPEPEATLSDTFDGLNELDLVDFYQHQSNWSNRMIVGNSQRVMASLA